MKKDKIWIPIVITGIILLYYCLIIYLLLTIEMPPILLFIGIPISLLFTGMLIFQCVTRIKEIKGGYYDDLSQY